MTPMPSTLASTIATRLGRRRAEGVPEGAGRPTRKLAGALSRGRDFFLQANDQSASNEYRESLIGDLDPKWTEVWAHIRLGNIYDAHGQRDRAVNEYNHAIRTRYNFHGAQDEAAKYLKQPYELSAKTSSQYTS